MSTRIVCWIVVLAAACSGYSGDEAGARQLVSDLRSGKTTAESLRPNSEDFRAVFVDEVAANVEAAFAKEWGKPLALNADPLETELEILSATTDDLRTGAEAARAFPNGYKRVADRLRPGLRFYTWRYKQPGDKHGTRFDGLVYVNNRWVWFPKPWRLLAR